MLKELKYAHLFFYRYAIILKNRINSVAGVHVQNILTERQPRVSEVSANFCG
jgi:hypothetical protein